MNILAHHVNEKNYLSILNAIQSQNNMNLLCSNLNEKIFDMAHLQNPTLIIIPIYEYSQEFHDFVSLKKQQYKICIYFGNAFHKDVFDQCTKNNIQTIGQKNTNCTHSLQYNSIYDSIIFCKDNTTERNNRTLCVLSHDNDINHKFLDGHLYPQTELQISLINNPNFKHKQNIGIAVQSDLNTLLNSYKNVIDLDNQIALEAQACGINNLEFNTDDNIETAVVNNKCKPQINDINKYSATNFVENVFIPKIRGL